MSKRWARWAIFLGIGLVVVATVVAAVVAVFMTDRETAGDGSAAGMASSSTAGARSPYDLTELPEDGDFDLDELVQEASFISITITNSEGRLTSYGIDADKATARDLIAAIGAADEIDARTTAAPPGSEGVAAAERGGDGVSAAGAIGPLLVFVLPSRETLTFALDLENSLVSRGARTWRPAGDLPALIDAATTP